MKRVLIITYYWPPSGGAGVQRWLKFTKYLPASGWKPVVYTPENPEAPANDETLFKDVSPECEVVKRRIWEPYSWYKKFLGIRKEQKINAGFISEEEKPKLKEKVSVWIRGNFFIPDARVFWVKPSVRYLRKYLKENPVDLIITTGPPHSMHLIALGLKKYTDIPWIADFRDPWSEIDFYDQLMLTPSADRRHKKLENKVLLGAQSVVAVGKIRGADLEKLCGRKIEVIENGFDEDDFKNVAAEKNKKFTIVHVGAMNRDRNHEAFWQALGDIKKMHPSFAEESEIKLIGKTDISVDRYILQYELGDLVSKVEYLPHAQIAGVLVQAHLLYLPINNMPKPKNVMPGKLFEYLASGTPVLGSGPVDGDAAAILMETGRGLMLDFYDREGIREALIKAWKSMDNAFAEQGDEHLKYSRKNLTISLVKLMNKLSQESSSSSAFSRKPE